MAKKIYDIMPPKEEPKNPPVSGEKAEKNSGILPIRIAKEPKAVFASTNVPENIQTGSMPELVKKPSSSSFPAQPVNFGKANEAVGDEKEQFEKRYSAEPSQKPQKPHRKISFKKWAIISGCVLLGIIMIYFFFALQKAEIAIWPKTELKSASLKITADKNATGINLENKVIPAEIFEIQKDLWQDFPATGTGQNSSKASGTIKIYNKLNPPSAFTLKTGTHFLSDSGKYFVTSEKVTIPAGTLKNGKLTPGSVSVKVTAEETGKDSNIGASKFSIPKLAGTNYYYSIYAESSGSMTGGFASDVKQVTSADLQNAKTELSKKILAEAESDLRKKIPADYVLFDNAISNNVTETFSPVKAGDTVDNFSYQAKVKATALAFKRQDIEKFAKDIINSQVAEKNILDQGFKIDFIPDSVDLTAGKMVLDSDFSAKVYEPVDTNDLTLLFMQKKATEIKDIAKSRLADRLERLDIKFWPFWTAKAPSNRDKIKVDLKFE